MTEITTDEWRAELDRVYGAQDADGMSVRELAAALGLGPVTARGYLHRAIDAGVWEFAGKAQRPSIDGRRCRVSVYRPVEGRGGQRTDRQSRKVEEKPCRFT